MDYIILSSLCPSELGREVTKFLNNNFKCQGGVSVVFDKELDSLIFYQAMVSC